MIDAVLDAVLDNARKPRHFGSDRENACNVLDVASVVAVARRAARALGGRSSGTRALKSERPARFTNQVPLINWLPDLGRQRRIVEDGVLFVAEPSEPDFTLRSEKRDRIRSHLLGLIEEGTAGSSIPSERQLCEQLGVSRPTLRSVVDHLVRDGLLVRRQGSGVFIARAKISQRLGQVGGTGSHAPQSVDGTWTSRTLRFEVMAADARVARRLQLTPRDPVVRFDRIRLVDGEPVCVETIHLPRRLVPDLESPDLDGSSLYALLRERFDLTVAKAIQIIEPTVADEEEAALLRVPAYSPALLFERTTQDELGRTVEFTRSIYRGDRFRIVSTLELGGDVNRDAQSVLVGRWSSPPA